MLPASAQIYKMPFLIGSSVTPFQTFLLFYSLAVLSTSRGKQKSSGRFSFSPSLFHPWNYFFAFRFYLDSSFLPCSVRCRLNVTLYTSHIRILYRLLLRYRTRRSVRCKRTNEKKADRGREKNKIAAIKTAQNDHKRQIEHILMCFV